MSILHRGCSARLASPCERLLLTFSAANLICLLEKDKKTVLRMVNEMLFRIWLNKMCDCFFVA